MFCPKCGQVMPSEGKFCANCGVPNLSAGPAIPQSPRLEKKKNQGNPVALAIIFLIFLGVGLFLRSSSELAANQIGMFFEILAGVIFFILFVWLFVFWIQLSIKKPKYLIILPVIIAALILPAYFVINAGRANDVVKVKTALADFLATKSFGDDIANGKINYLTLTDVAGNAGAILDQLGKIKVSSNLAPDLAAITKWTEDMKTAAEGSNWGSIGGVSLPMTTFSLKTQESLFEDTLNKLADLKELGDYSLAKGDKDAMRFIGASIEAEYVWLNSFTIDQDEISAALTSPKIEFIGQAHALTRSNLGVCRKDGGSLSTCFKKVKESLPKTFRPAYRYSVGEPDAAPSWDTAWTGMADSVSFSGPAGAGVTVGADNRPQPPASLQNFYNDCRAKGGTTAVATSIKERLPTTAGGYTCQYGNGCWDFMTYGNQRYMGGNPGCPEQNLLPRVRPAPTPTPDDNNKPPIKKSYNGTYNIHYTSGGCNVPGFIYQSIGPFSDQVVVSNNQVTSSSGSAIINSAGQARVVMNIGYTGISGQLVQTFNFSGTSVSGNLTFSAATSGVSVSCHGTFTGQKVGN